MTLKELLLRFLIGGGVVSCFAAISDVVKPVSFAGLFGAAPSVALATLGLTIATKGRLYASREACSMALGAIALGAYCWAVSRVLARRKLPALAATSLAIPLWFLVAFGLWFALVR